LVHGKDNDSVCNTEHHVDSGKVSLYEFDGQFLFFMFMIYYTVSQN